GFKFGVVLVEPRQTAEHGLNLEDDLPFGQLLPRGVVRQGTPQFTLLFGDQIVVQKLVRNFQRIGGRQQESVRSGDEVFHRLTVTPPARITTQGGQSERHVATGSWPS